MIVTFERSPASWAAACTSSHWPVVTLSGQLIRRTSSSRISAAVPGSEPSPAARSRPRYSPTGGPQGRGALPDLERRERVHVEIRQRAPDHLHHVEIELSGEGRMDPALQAELGRAAPRPPR